MILDNKFKLLVIGNKDLFIHLEKFLSELLSLILLFLANFDVQIFKKVSFRNR